MTRGERVLARCAELERRLSSQIWLMAILAAVVFFAGSIATDISRPLWYDEIYTRYISRLNSPASIWQALKMSVDNQPFPFYLITHYSQLMFGDNAFAIRFAGTLGFAVMCVCIYIFTRARTNRLMRWERRCFRFHRALSTMRRKAGRTAWSWVSAASCWCRGRQPAATGIENLGLPVWQLV